MIITHPIVDCVSNGVHLIRRRKSFYSIAISYQEKAENFYQQLHLNELNDEFL